MDTISYYSLTRNKKDLGNQLKEHVTGNRLLLIIYISAADIIRIHFSLCVNVYMHIGLSTSYVPHCTRRHFKGRLCDTKRITTFEQNSIFPGLTQKREKNYILV
jgi:hypothetical protein